MSTLQSIPALRKSSDILNVEDESMWETIYMIDYTPAPFEHNIEVNPEVGTKEFFRKKSTLERKKGMDKNNSITQNATL